MLFSLKNSPNHAEGPIFLLEVADPRRRNLPRSTLNKLLHERLSGGLSMSRLTAINPDDTQETTPSTKQGYRSVTLQNCTILLGFLLRLVSQYPNAPAMRSTRDHQIPLSARIQRVGETFGKMPLVSENRFQPQIRVSVFRGGLGLQLIGVLHLSANGLSHT